MCGKHFMKRDMEDHLYNKTIKSQMSIKCKNSNHCVEMYPSEEVQDINAASNTYLISMLAFSNKKIKKKCLNLTHAKMKIIISDQQSQSTVFNKYKLHK